MTKEELLKIYSAYLPYRLELIYNDCLDGKRQIAYLSGVLETEIETTFKRKQGGCSGDYISWVGNNNVNDLNVKPILYPLEYLNKEIEHEGETFVPMSKLRSEFGYLPNTSHHEHPQVQIYFKLLEWHFNVFQLPEGQFINKATLTNK